MHVFGVWEGAGVPVRGAPGRDQACNLLAVSHYATVPPPSSLFYFKNLQITTDRNIINLLSPQETNQLLHPVDSSVVTKAK